MEARLITKTVGVEGTEYHGRTLDEIIVGIARISSSRETNELFDEAHKLIRHCISNGHWSIFTEANLGFEITTSRAIGREYLRHKGSNFQERSLRYTSDVEIEAVEMRKQAKSNRQSSTVPITKFDEVVDSIITRSVETYESLIAHGVAKETARFILPECTRTTIIMNATIREWITTLNQRLHKTAQKEARLIAEAVRDEFMNQLPIVSAALFNFVGAYEMPVLDRVVLEKYGCYEYYLESKKCKST